MGLRILFLIMVVTTVLPAQIVDYVDNKISFKVFMCALKNDSVHVTVFMENTSNDSILLSETNGNYIFMGNNSTLHLFLGWDQGYPDGNLRMRSVAPKQSINFEETLLGMPIMALRIMLNYLHTPKFTHKTPEGDSIILGRSHLLNGIWQEMTVRSVALSQLAKCVD